MIVQVLFCVVVSLLSVNMNAQDLKKHQWKNRVLIIQTTSVTSDKYDRQMREFDVYESGLAERKIVLYEVTEKQFRQTDFKSTSNRSDWNNIDQIDYFPKNKKQTFQVTLIGLDGGIKLQQTDILTQKELYNIIDSMPMRAAELSNNK